MSSDMVMKHPQTFASIIRNIFLFKFRLMPKLRAKFYNYIFTNDFSHVGKNAKLFISKNLVSEPFKNMRIGDYCWIEAVGSYGEQKFSPSMCIGSDVSLSDFVHISCVSSINIMSGVLIGSKVYIGDHSHGSYIHNGEIEEYCKNTIPSKRNLGDIGPIFIGRNCWVGDNAVILRNTNICDGCVIAANAVVANITVSRPALIGGIPAKVIRYF